VKENCCIVPPPYFVEQIGEPGTYWEVPIAPSPTHDNITYSYILWEFNIYGTTTLIDYT
jgi:hypothetical protein